MKKARIAAAALAAALALTACTPTVNPSSEVSPDSQLVWDSSSIEELYNETGTVPDTDQDYTYRVPLLPPQSADAQEINDSIEGKEGALATQMLSVMDEGNLPGVTYIDWTAAWNGSTVALVLETAMSDGLPWEYSVHNYDFAEQRKVPNDEILEMAGFTEAEFTEALRRAVLEWYDQHAGSCLVAGTGLGVDRRAEAIADEALALDRQRIFLDERGELTVICTVGDAADTGRYTSVFLYPHKPAEQAPAVVEEDCVRAELSDGKVLLSFTETENAQLFLPDFISYDTAYPVEGLYGEYTRMELINQGQEYAPILFFTDINGGVSFCDVMEGASAGGVFTARGPLDLPARVTRIEGVSESEGDIVYAFSEEGSRMDLSEAVMQSYDTQPLSLYGSHWTAPGETAYLDFDGDGARSLIWQEPDGTTWGGRYRYMGMTGEGLRFFLLAWNDSGVLDTGILYMDLNSSEAPRAQLRLNGGQSGEFTEYLPMEALSGMPEEELCELARLYYEEKYGVNLIVEADGRTEDGVVLHLYEDMGTHTATYAWYVIDPVTLTGYDEMTREAVDLNEVTSVG